MESIVHVYPQFCEHDTAFLVGDREGMTRLRDAINAALTRSGDLVDHVDVFTADGEGYNLVVLCVESDAMEPLILPYQGENAGPKTGVHPWGLMKFQRNGDQDQYRLQAPSDPSEDWR